MGPQDGRGARAPDTHRRAKGVVCGQVAGVVQIDWSRWLLPLPHQHTCSVTQPQMPTQLIPHAHRHSPSPVGTLSPRPPRPCGALSTVLTLQLPSPAPCGFRKCPQDERSPWKLTSETTVGRRRGEVWPCRTPATGPLLSRAMDSRWLHPHSLLEGPCSPESSYFSVAKAFSCRTS